MIVTIQLKRGPSSDWATANPVLGSGEPGWDTDLRRLKIGNGSTPWTSLPWASLTAEDMEQIEALLENVTDLDDGRMTSVLLDTESDFSTRVYGSFAGRNLTPAAVAASAENFYDAGRSLYNYKPSNTINVRGSLARASAGGAGGRWAFAGDSLTAGYPGDVATSSTPVRVRDALTQAGVQILGTGPVILNPGGAPGGFFDPRWEFTGTWTGHAGTATGMLKGQIGATATFTSDLPGTIAEICYLAGGQATVAVDGGSATPVDSSGSGTLKRHLVTGLSDAVHAVTVSVTAADFFLEWGDVRRATTGLLIGNFGVSQTTAENWAESLFYFPRGVVSNWDPDVTFLELETNDNGQGVAPNAFKASLRTSVEDFLTYGDVILVTSNYTDAADMPAYKARKRLFEQAKYELADEYDIPLIDFGSLVDDYVDGVAQGLFADQVHLSSSGYFMKADAVVRATRGI